VGRLPVRRCGRVRRSPIPRLDLGTLGPGRRHCRHPHRQGLLARHGQRPGHRLRERPRVLRAVPADNGDRHRPQRQRARLLAPRQGRERLPSRGRRLLRRSLRAPRAVQGDRNHTGPKRLLAPQRHGTRVQLRRRVQLWLKDASGHSRSHVPRFCGYTKWPGLLGNYRLRGHMELWQRARLGNSGRKARRVDSHLTHWARVRGN
jgi:hypothetical protein